jgi:hypothetical protein
MGDASLTWAEEYQLHLDKAAIYDISYNDKDAFKCLQAAAWPKGRAFDSGVPGHKFIFGTDCVRLFNEPKLIKFKSSDDAIVVCYKQREDVLYFMGMTVPDVINFKPPAQNQPKVSFTQAIKTWRSDLESIVAIEDVKNTATHDIRKALDKVLPHVAFPNAPKEKAIGLPFTKWADITRLANNGYEKNIKAATTAAQTIALKEIAERGDKSRDAAERAAVGDIKQQLNISSELMLTFNTFYKQPLAQRLIEIPIKEGDGLPTKEAFTTTRESLKFALPAAARPRARSALDSRHRTHATHTRRRHTHTHTPTCRRALAGTMSMVCGSSRASMRSK